MPDPDVQLDVVTIGNPIEDTPEGLHLMDGVRQAEERQRKDLEERFGPGAVAVLDEVNAEVERKMLFGDEG